LVGGGLQFFKHCKPNQQMGTTSAERKVYFCNALKIY
jgi:hypothetical protein